MSRYSRQCGQSSSWCDKGWSPSTNEQQSAKSSYSRWTRWGTTGNPGEHEGRDNHWDEGSSHDFAKDGEGDAAEGQDKNRGDAGTEEGGETARAPKVSAPESVNVTDVETTHKKLWELQHLLNHRKGSLGSTLKKNAEANTKSYHLNQKTVQALDTLAEEYEIFEETMTKVTHETEEGDTLFAVACEAMEELGKAEKTRTVCMMRWRLRAGAW